jgi:gliding motility-associated-like protein
MKSILLLICLTLASSARFSIAQSVSFASPDSVCVNTPLSLQNTSTGGTSYYWTFCVSDLSAVPVATNLGNPGGLLYGPAFMDFADDNGTFYGYVVNNDPGQLIQLNFGNSLLNTPTATSLGNLGGSLIASEEGIQLVHNNGNWYAVIVGGTPASGGIPSVVTVNFGASLGNTSPTSNNWGNIGNLAYPTSLKLVQQGGNWYGFTVNANNNTVTRFDFGTNFNVAPTGVNLGDLGNLSQPTGMSFIQTGGNWYLYLVNQTNSSITRFDFGNSLTNSPTAINLGNPGNALNQPRDMTTIQSCGTTKGFVVSYGDNSIDRIDFPSGPASDTLGGEDLGNLGNMSFPQSVSRIFQEGPDLYMFVTNITNSSITRFVFSGCDSSSIPSSNAFAPPPVTYTSPGTYHISLQMDVGLPSQQSFCKPVVVLPPPTLSLPSDTASCSGMKLMLKVSGYNGAAFLWSNGSDSSTTIADTAGRYWVKVSDYGCSASDTIKVAIGITPSIYLPADTQFCDSGKLKFVSGLPVTYTWNTGSDSSATIAYSNGKYKLTLDNGGCTSSDSSEVTIVAAVKAGLPQDTSFCGRGVLQGSSGNGLLYTWSTGATSSSITVTASGLYWLQVGEGTCANRDSTQVIVNALPTVSLGNDTMVCVVNPYLLAPNAQPPGSLYHWQDGSTRSSYFVTATGVYSVSVTSAQGCTDSSTVSIAGVVLPVVSFGGKVPFCPGEVIKLRPSTDSVPYTWQDGSTDSVFVAPGPGTYSVTSTNICGTAMASVVVYPGLCIVRVPSAFTPNGDGVNDVFRVLGIDGVDEFSLSVYNRWGQKIFGTSDKLSGWDGTFRGIPEPSDAYIYEAGFRLIADGQYYRLSGTVTLIR